MPINIEEKVHLAIVPDNQNYWPQILRILNQNNPKIIVRHKGIPLALVTDKTCQEVCDLLQKLPLWQRFGFLALLAKTPFSWEFTLACSTTMPRI